MNLANNPNLQNHPFVQKWKKATIKGTNKVTTKAKSHETLYQSPCLRSATEDLHHISSPKDDKKYDQQTTIVLPEIILTDIQTKNDSTKETNTINTTQSDYPFKTSYSNNADFINMFTTFWPIV
jgi:hypothetical protein